MSGTCPALLKRRALSTLRLAERLLAEGEYDLAALNAEYAAQLYVKSLLYRVSGEKWRGNGVRTLLGALAAVLEEQGYRAWAERIIDYVWANRRLLAELEEAHTRAVYSALEYSREQACILVKAAREFVELLRGLEESILGEWREEDA